MHDDELDDRRLVAVGGGGVAVVEQLNGVQEGLVVVDVRQRLVVAVHRSEAIVVNLTQHQLQVQAVVKYG